MSQITAEQVKKLREATGLSLSACKKALEETAGDHDKAIELLRKAGAVSAQKKEGREVAEGAIAHRITGSHYALVELACETDFVARNEDFVNGLNLIVEALASHPLSSPQELAAVKVKDGRTVEEVRSALVQKLGENIQIKRVALVDRKPNSSHYIYYHNNGRIMSMVEIDGDTDKSELAKDVAMHISFASPLYIEEGEIHADVKKQEISIYQEQIKGKPAQIADKIIEGKWKSYCEQVCLNMQKFIKDDSKSIADLLASHGKHLKITKIIRWKAGEAS